MGAAFRGYYMNSKVRSLAGKLELYSYLSEAVVAVASDNMFSERGTDLDQKTVAQALATTWKLADACVSAPRTRTGRPLVLSLTNKSTDMPPMRFLQIASHAPDTIRSLKSSFGRAVGLTDRKGDKWTGTLPP
jgi:hypothetical protein